MTRERVKKVVDEYYEKGLLEKITLGDSLKSWAEKYKDKTALVEEGGTITYEELWKESYTLALMFLKDGIRKKDNVLVQLPNSITFVKTCFALFMIGTRPILMMPSHRERELEAVSVIAEPVAIVTVKTELGIYYEKLAIDLKEKVKSIQRIYVDGEGDWGKNINQVESIDESVTHIDNPPDAYDIALFLLSGGTTGTPKLIPKIHAAYLCNGKESAKRCEVTDESVYLAALSIAHDYPLCCPGVIGTLANGGKCVLCRTSSLEEVLPWIEAQKVTFTSIVPVVAAMWTEALEWSEITDTSSLRHILIGAAKLETELARRLEESFDCKIIQGYGLGEGVTCFTSPKDSSDIAWQTQGRPISPGDVIRIVNEKGEPVSEGESGELIQTGPYTFFGYYRAPRLNEALFTKEGYFKTGDKAKLTKDGNIVILGRVREQINRAGENIIPEEIESFVRACEDIKEAAVIGLPDKELGERICVAAVKKDKEISLTKLCQFLSSQGIANFKLPDQLVYVNELPYINVGKVDKKLLKDRLLQQ
jgi:2,3-dihydroxybenzoate-AMP ligase